MELESKDIINIFALVFSPVVALLISTILQNKKELRERKFNIFLTLISTRHEVITAEQAKAFNSIDVIFSDSDDVRKKWKEYFDLLKQENRIDDWAKAKLELMQVMADNVGYNKSVIDHLDLDRIYSPVGLTKLEQKQSAILDKWEKFLDESKVKVEKISKQD